MWKTLIKIWNVSWGIIGGLAVIVGLFAGFYTLYDRFTPKNLEAPSVKEYIFGTTLYYVQVLTTDLNKVIAYGVTTRDKFFNPSFHVLGNTHVTLGKTRFIDIGVPRNIVWSLGAHEFYYHEEYYFGNLNNYKFYFFSANISGHTTINNHHLLKKRKLNPHNTEVSKFRSTSKVNTFYITAPHEGWTNVVLRRYQVGPDYYQVRVIPKSAIPNALDKDKEYVRLSKLSTNVDIENIIAILGRPLIINDKPNSFWWTDEP